MSAPLARCASADAERGRQARDGRMDDGGEMRVVEVEAMQQHAVDEGRIPQRQPLAVPDHGAGAVAAERPRAGQRALRERIAARREPDADGIEHQLQRALAHGLGHFRQPHAGHELGQPARGNRRRVEPPCGSACELSRGVMAASFFPPVAASGRSLTAPPIFVPIAAR